MKKNVKTTILALAFASASLVLPLRSDAALVAIRGGGGVRLPVSQRSALLRTFWHDSTVPDFAALSISQKLESNFVLRKCAGRRIALEFYTCDRASVEAPHIQCDASKFDFTSLHKCP